MITKFSRLIPCLIMFAIILPLTSCDEAVESDKIPPTVTITSPIDGSTVSEMAAITCMASDDVKIQKVELWTDGISSGLIDETEPYSFLLNTASYEDGSAHTIIARAYDSNDNTTDSAPIVIYIDNTNSFPATSTILSIRYRNSSLKISWTMNYDEDFYSYSLYQSYDSTISEGELIFESTDQSDTSYLLTPYPANERRYFQITVSDTLPFKSFSPVVVGSSFPRIVSSQYINGRFEIVLMDIYGQNLETLTTSLEGSSGGALFSPDDSQIVFGSWVDDDYELFLYDLDLSTILQITSNTGIDQSPRFSSNGTEIIFVSQKDGNHEIYSMSSDGSNQRNLTNHVGRDANPRFALDDNSIVFTSDRDGDWEIFSINHDGSNLRQLTSNETRDFLDDVSPDGVYISCWIEQQGKSDIYILSLITGEQIDITNDDAYDYESCISPDGEDILYASDSSGNWDIWIINIDGKNRINLTPGADIERRPTFSPDGTKIAFLRNDALWIMDRSGNNAMQLSNASIGTFKFQTIW